MLHGVGDMKILRISVVKREHGQAKAKKQGPREERVGGL
jgi:hypothetical protein